MKMKLVIPMAGLGTRMRPHTWARPKPLLPLAGQTMLDHILDSFDALSLDEYVFIIGYLGDQVEAYVRHHYERPTHFVEQHEMLGQSHAIWLAREHLEGPILLTYVDTFVDEADFSGLDDEDLDGVIFTHQVDDPRRFGVVETDEAGWATTLIEKPESMDNKDVLVGLYYFRDGAWLARACRELMDRDIKTKGEYYLADTVTLMIEQGARFQVREVGVWKDTGKPETTFETHRYLLEHGYDNSYLSPRPGVALIPPVFVHPDATIERSVIGPYVSIGKDAEVRGSILRDTLVDEAAKLEAVMLSRSIIGRWVTLEGRPQQLNIGDSSTLEQ
jgi:glucose-1-phosphate thymidylyltransferase